MCQTDNDVVVVDVAESGVVSALPPGLVQDQIPAVHSGQEILVLSETAKQRPHKDESTGPFQSPISVQTIQYIAQKLTYCLQHKLNKAA